MYNKCATISRSLDPIIAPNGYIFLISFEGMIEPDPIGLGLIADITNEEWQPFYIQNGEIL